MGAVVAISGGEWTAHAVVRGGRNYRVEINRDRDAFRASCDCPYFTDRGEICKHIWAAVIEADERLLLAGNGEPLEAFLEPEVNRTGSRKRPNLSVTLQKAPAPWQRFLTDLNQRLEADERSTVTRRFIEGELLYTLDVPQTKAGRGVVLHVLHRTRRKNGEWAKPKPAPVSAQEIDDLPELDDREIHAQLLGAVDQAALQASYYGQVQSERATYLLVNSSAARLLPRLVHTGRLHLTLERGVPEPDPLVWDDGLPWHFDLTIATVADGSIRVDGALQRDGERMDLREPMVLLDAGFLATRVALARFDPGDAFPWIAELRRSNSVTFPGTAADSLAEALARAGVKPERLPERLQYEVRATTPQPSVTLARTGRAVRGRLPRHARRGSAFRLRGDIRRTRGRCRGLRRRQSSSDPEGSRPQSRGRSIACGSSDSSKAGTIRTARRRSGFQSICSRAPCGRS